MMPKVPDRRQDAVAFAEQFEGDFELKQPRMELM